MSDTADLNIVNLQVYAEEQAEIDKANGTFEANIAADPHYYLWQSDFQTVPLGAGDDPAAFVEAMLIAVPGVNCVRIPFNENSFNEDGSLSPEMEGLLQALADNDIMIIPVLAEGDAQETTGTSAEIQAELAGETYDSIVNGWTLMLAWMEENPDVEDCVYGYELLNEPAAFDQAINLADPEDAAAVAEDMAALYVQLMLELDAMISESSDAKILVDAWGYAGQTDFLATTMIGDQTAAELLEEGIGDDLVWSVHFYPGWQGTGDITDQAELEEALADLLAPFGDSDVIITEINVPGTTTYDPYAGNQVTTATALSLDFLIDSGVGIGWFPAMQTGSSGLAFVEADGDIRYLNQPSLAAALDGFSRGDEPAQPKSDDVVEIDLVEATLRNQETDPDYADGRLDLVDYAGFGFGYAGNDTITGSDLANNFLYGGSGQDILTGATHDDYLFGQDGDDSINSGLGIDHLIGGAGNDTLVAQGSYTIIYGEADSDLFVQDGGQDVTFADFDFTEGDRWAWRQDAMLTGYVATDLTADSVLDLKLNFSDGTSIVLIGAGDVEQISMAFAGLNLDNMQSSSSIFVKPSLAVGVPGIVSQGQTAFRGTDAGEVIAGSASHDSIEGRAGNDLLYGEVGNDTLIGGKGTDTLIGGEGQDVIAAGESGGFISGGNGNDTIKGNIGADVILGEAGLDSVRAGGENDLIYGGADADTIRGGKGNDAIYGGEGNDTLNGESGNNSLVGEAGNDTLIWNGGVDVIDGGEGLDFLQISGSNSVTVNMEIGTLSSVGGVQVTFIDVENVFGGNSSDVIVGSTFQNSLSGGAGDDLLQGGGGKDTLEGGRDTDTLTGGTGDDCFIFDLTSSSGSSDLITDFRASDDTILLRSVPGAGLEPGALDSSSFLANTTGMAETGIDRIIFNTQSGSVYFDSDGTGSAARVHLFDVNAGTSLSYADFILM